MSRIVHVVSNLISGSQSAATISASVVALLKSQSHQVTSFSLLDWNPEPCDEIVVIGGDGSAGSVLAKVSHLKSIPRVTILPYGVGNDLCRAVGYYELPLHQVFQEPGHTAFINLWEVRIKLKDPLKQGALHHHRFEEDAGFLKARFTNYLSFGQDAKIVASVEAHRKTTFGQNTFKCGLAKAVYCCLGVRNTMSLSVEKIEDQLKVDGINLEDLQQLAFLNIPYYSGGGYVNNLSKGSLTVIGFRSLLHQLLFYSNLREPERIGCLIEQEISVLSETFLQLDGEALRLPEATLWISHCGQVPIRVQNPSF